MDLGDRMAAPTLRIPTPAAPAMEDHPMPGAKDRRDAVERATGGATTDPLASDLLGRIRTEVSTFQERRAELCREHEGRFVLIKGTEVIAFFDDRREGVREGYRRYGDGPFLVLDVTPSDPVLYLPNVIP
jgi:hypothetical protein